MSSLYFLEESMNKSKSTSTTIETKGENMPSSSAFRLPKKPSLTGSTSTEDLQENYKKKSRNRNTGKSERKSRSRSRSTSNSSRTNKPGRSRTKSKNKKDGLLKDDKKKRRKSRGRSKSIEKSGKVGQKTKKSRSSKGKSRSRSRSHDKYILNSGFLMDSNVILEDDREQPSVVSEVSSTQRGRPNIFKQNSTKSTSAKEANKRVCCHNGLTYRLRCCLKCLLHFRVLKIFQVLCAVYICIYTLKGPLMDPKTGLVIDKDSAANTAAGLICVNDTCRAIVGETHFQVVSILIARLSAWFMYPSKF